MVMVLVVSVGCSKDRWWHCVFANYADDLSSFVDVDVVLGIKRATKSLLQSCPMEIRDSDLRLSKICPAFGRVESSFGQGGDGSFGSFDMIFSLLAT